MATPLEQSLAAAPNVSRVGSIARTEPTQCYGLLPRLPRPVCFPIVCCQVLVHCDYLGCVRAAAEYNKHLIL